MIINLFFYSVRENIKIIAGTHNLTAITQQFNVSNVIIHPNHEPKTLQNDISLVKISEKFIFNDFVKPIELNSQLVGGNETLTFGKYIFLNNNLKNIQFDGVLLD